MPALLPYKSPGSRDPPLRLILLAELYIKIHTEFSLGLHSMERLLLSDSSVPYIHSFSSSVSCRSHLPSVHSTFHTRPGPPTERSIFHRTPGIGFGILEPHVPNLNATSFDSRAQSLPPG